MTTTMMSRRRHQTGQRCSASNSTSRRARQLYLRANELALNERAESKKLAYFLLILSIQSRYRSAERQQPLLQLPELASCLPASLPTYSRQAFWPGHQVADIG